MWDGVTVAKEHHPHSALYEDHGELEIKLSSPSGIMCNRYHSKHGGSAIQARLLT
jgi:hypothetical protein